MEVSNPGMASLADSETMAADQVKVLENQTAFHQQNGPLLVRVQPNRVISSHKVQPIVHRSN
jgi:hypothetical protein